MGGTRRKKSIQVQDVTTWSILEKSLVFIFCLAIQSEKIKTHHHYYSICLKSLLDHPTIYISIYC